MRGLPEMPVQAVTQRGSQHVAYVKVGSHIERREVTVGSRGSETVNPSTSARNSRH